MSDRQTRGETTLRVTEIFRSLQGESTLVGLPTVFVRLTGCPMRCRYCDTAYAFHGGRRMRIDEVLAEVAAQHTPYVCVTGGEPLAQAGCLSLLRALCDAGHTVSLETGGAIDIGEVDERVIRVLDVKTPGSGETGRYRWENLDRLRPSDQLKFVICDREDFDWAVKLIRERQLDRHCTVLMSPSHEQLPARTLAEWILESGLPLRMQIQLHKYLWGNAPGH